MGKHWYEGQEYDYLFDLDINGIKMKLPFNRGDDPWMAAQKWIWAHSDTVDQMHLDAIANHIIANTPGNVVESSANFADPVTGGSRYIPGSANPAGLTPGNSRPFRPEGGIVAGGYAANQSSAGGSSNGAGASGASRAAPSAFAIFDTCKHDAVLNKLLDFNKAAGDLALSADATNTLTALIGILKTPAGTSAPSITKDHINLFLGSGSGADGLLAWPTPVLFPAADIFRLLVLQPAAAKLLANAAPPALPRILGQLTSAQAAPAGDKPANAAGLMFLRCLANMTSKRELRDVVAAGALEQLDCLSKPIDEGPAPARLAACSVLNNLAVLDWRALPADSARRSDAWTVQALSLLSHAFTNVPALRAPEEEESLHRLLLALHALLGGASESGPTPGAVDSAKDLELGASLTALGLPAGGKLAALADRCAKKLA